MAMGPVSGRNGGKRAPMAEINVTPLVDVMLVLLIIFMVTAPLLMAGVPVKLPDSRAGALEQEQKPLQLSLDARGSIYIDEEEVALPQLASRLAAVAAAAAGKEPPQVFLRADTQLDYGRVMAVMGELNHAGLNKVALVTNSAADTAAPGGGAATPAGTTRAGG
ncbi:protein TolR [Sphingomonas naphthae]|uniref:Protein TolR n=1 Tax=Sphingomonas naphthae TaxID=1813468 RepID=A0ABY7TI57_9SPHN|nr:protein TolR [Sphingomonas naphthae]WCT72476.1 protein TolR [Sphingomonas naphthae]